MSVLSSGAECGIGVYLEVSSAGSGARIGDHSILSFVDIGDETIPSNVVLHALKQRDGKFVARIYGVEDNPKTGSGGSFLGSTLEEFMGRNQVSESDLWDTEEHTLWTARLYPVYGNIRGAVKAALNVYAMSCGQGDTAAWKASPRASLKSGFFYADLDALIAWEKRMGELVKMDMLAKLVSAGYPVSEAQGLLTDGKLTPIQAEWMEGHLSAAEYGDRMRLNYYVGKALGGAEGERFISRCFREIQKAVLEPGAGQWKREKECRIVQEECTVKLPLRLNWGGGWSDTPPYCCENGGTVLNAAVLLKGEMPVTARLTRLEERKVVLSSADMGVYGEFFSMDSLQSVGDPYDPYVLQKAALIACGMIPEDGGDLEEVLARLGGGFRMDTEVTGVPKGSGLGTSSILAAACVRALFVDGISRIPLTGRKNVLS